MNRFQTFYPTLLEFAKQMEIYDLLDDSLKSESPDQSTTYQEETHEYTDVDMDELLDQVLFEFGVEYRANNPNESLYQQERSSAKDQMTPLASFPTYEIDPLEPLY